MSYLGIEFGSTRIKAVVVNDEFVPVSSGDYTWSSKMDKGIWTYDLEECWTGIKAALKNIAPGDVKAIGISGMMHGYLAFDKDWNLLVPFRTWQNTITAKAATELTKLFEFNIPQRWSIAHLYQAVLNGEEHINKVAHITTLAGYVHFMLTGVNAVGIGEASGIFPIDSDKLDYDKTMLAKLEEILVEKKLPWKLSDVLPKVLMAGENAGRLTTKGRKLIGEYLSVGIPFAPPEGDAGTGMTATNAVARATGNISAGTSIFSMIVLNKRLDKVYEEIDMVTTPTGKPVAMVHCNNGTNDSNAWIAVFKETLELFGLKPMDGEMYTRLYEKSLEGDADCGGILVCNYVAGEGITHVDEGRPLVVRNAESKFTLANFLRATLYSTMVTLKLGMEILEKEKIEIKSLTAHGGLFKTPIVGQRYIAAACKTPVTVMQTAGEGGPYGMAILAAYSVNKVKGEVLERYLENKVFVGVKGSTVIPDESDVAGFTEYTQRFKNLLQVEKAAVENV